MEKKIWKWNVNSNFSFLIPTKVNFTSIHVDFREAFKNNEQNYNL